MGLSAYLHKTKEITITAEGETYKNPIQIAYFRNNWALQAFLGSGDDTKILSEKQLENVKYEAQEDEDVNKDHGDGDSVLSVIDTAIAAARAGYLVYYTASY